MADSRSDPDCIVRPFPFLGADVSIYEEVVIYQLDLLVVIFFSAVSFSSHFHKAGKEIIHLNCALFFGVSGAFSLVLTQI